MLPFNDHQRRMSMAPRYQLDWLARADVPVRSLLRHAMAQRLVVGRRYRRVARRPTRRRWGLLGLRSLRVTRRRGGLSGFQIVQAPREQLYHGQSVAVLLLVVQQPSETGRGQRTDAVCEAAFGQVIVIGDGEFVAVHHCGGVPGWTPRQPRSRTRAAYPGYRA